MQLRAILLAVMVAGSAGAQSVNPPIAIFDGGSLRARGSFIIDNPTLYPITWIVEPKQFAVACAGDILFAPLDTARLTARLSAMSGRLGARQRTTVFYDVQSDSVPAWLAFVVALASGRPEPGLNIRLEIPHVVYLMQKEHAVASDVSIAKAEYDSSTKRLGVQVVNNSPKLTRITELVGVTARGREHALDACPLFPGATREFDLAWPDPDPPVRVLVRMQGFTLQQVVTVRSRDEARGKEPCALCSAR